eukprot:CAMPEP_0198494532 /NCGR_PEP_ID=MMETSP1462-20131121/4687_1 /TAXON_ID=1333877 /ORGANISM="Brandtodinium nutriculum, Strain RCC3387" /LENGTH=61 /DNA_ID=CAMNT_0044223271 /DNA_START=62 /DNA_END=243 /DNA_ORIENTATION=+
MERARCTSTYTRQEKAITWRRTPSAQRVRTMHARLYKLRYGQGGQRATNQVLSRTRQAAFG